VVLVVLFTACAAAVERKAPATSQEDSFVKPGFGLERGLRTKPGRGIPLHLQPSRLPPALVLFTACAAAVESDGVLVVVAAPALAQRVVGVHTGGRAVGLPRGSHWRLR
jgi:hypothetical protein